MFIYFGINNVHKMLKFVNSKKISGKLLPYQKNKKFRIKFRP